MLARKVYNNDDITFFFVYQRLQSPRVIMYCSPHRFADRAATHYHTRAWQTLIHGKECFILLLMRISKFVVFGLVTEKVNHTRCTAELLRPMICSTLNRLISTPGPNPDGHTCFTGQVILTGGQVIDDIPYFPPPDD